MEENCNFCPFDSCGLLQTCPSNLQPMHRRAMESEKLPGSVQRARWVVRARRFAHRSVMQEAFCSTSRDREAYEGEH